MKFLIPFFSFFFLFQAFGFSQTRVEPEAITMKDAEEEYLLKGKAEILSDKGGILTIDKVISAALQEQFKPFEGKNNYETGVKHYWLRFKVTNPDKEQRDYLLKADAVDWATLYIQKEDGSFGIKQSGALQSFSDRKVFLGREPHILFSVPEGKTRTVYLKAEIKLNYHKNNHFLFQPFEHLSLRSHIHAEEVYQESRYFQGLYLGAMLLMVLYNFFLFLFVKDRSYLFYVVFIFFDALANMVLGGYAMQYLWKSSAYFDLFSFFNFFTLSWIAYDLFIVTFLNLREKSQKWYRVFIILALGKGLFILLNLFDIWWLSVGLGLILGTSLIVFWLNVHFIMRRYRPARYLLFANAFFLIGVMVQGMAFLNLIPRTPFTTYYAEQAGDILQVVLFSIALADRINLMRDNLEEEHIKRERLRLQQEEERKKIIEEQNERLEIQVKERTTQIAAINDELRDQKEEIERQRDTLSVQKEEINRTLQDITVLSNIGKEITAALGIKEIIKTVYDRVNEMMDASVFAIGIHNPEKNTLEYNNYLINGAFQPAIEVGLEEANRISVWCWKNQEILLINDYDTEYSKYMEHKLRSKIVDKRQSLIYIPIRFENKPIGLLTVQSFDKNAYDDTDLSVLGSLAAYIAIALDNSAAYEKIEESNTEIELKNRQITDSLRYASNIQDIILPNEDNFYRLFKDLFIIYLPKDYVSGDFYWVKKIENKLFVAVGDCTGHGVPGAFMSMLGMMLLNQIFEESDEYNLAEMMERLNSEIKTVLKQEFKSNNDGIDMGICLIEDCPDDTGDKYLTYAGAKRPLFYVCKGTLKEIKGTRKSIGGGVRKRRKKEKAFTQEQIKLSPGDSIYMTSDGFVDQVSPQRQKLGSLRFFELLEQHYSLSMDEQKEVLLQEFNEHQATEEQRDDVTVLGIRI